MDYKLVLEEQIEILRKMQEAISGTSIGCIRLRIEISDQIIKITQSIQGLKEPKQFM